MKRKTASHLKALEFMLAGLFVFGGHSFAADASSVGQQTAAYQQLLSAKTFAFGGTGFAGTISEDEKAFHAVAGSQNALELFLAVLKNGSAEARMYALWGIRKLARQDFDAHAQLLASGNLKIRTMSGCLVSEESSSDVVARIGAGSYDLHIGIAQVR